jgi:hypothetical protein
LREAVEPPLGNAVLLLVPDHGMPKGSAPFLPLCRPINGTLLTAEVEVKWPSVGHRVE